MKSFFVRQHAHRSLARTKFEDRTTNRTSYIDAARLHSSERLSHPLTGMDAAEEQTDEVAKRRVSGPVPTACVPASQPLVSGYSALPPLPRDERGFVNSSGFSIACLLLLALCLVSLMDTSALHHQRVKTTASLSSNTLSYANSAYCCR